MSVLDKPACSFLLLLQVSGVAAQQFDPNDPARALIGCYQLEYGVSQFGALLPGQTPSTVRLTEKYGIDWPEKGRLLLQPVGESWSRLRFRWAFWHMSDVNIVTLVFSTGFSGYEVKVQRHEAMFRGTVVFWTDVITNQPPPQAQVTMTPISCASIARSSNNRVENDALARLTRIR